MEHKLVIGTKLLNIVLIKQNSIKQDRNLKKKRKIVQIWVKANIHNKGALNSINPGAS